jgi:hypothetical protein
MQLVIRHDDPNVFLHQSQIIERLQVMKIQEATHYRCADYLSALPLTSNTVDQWCRSKMIAWSFEVIDFLGFNRSTVLTALSYLDRFLSTGSPRAMRVIQSRKEFQLAMMTALYTAIKLFEPKIVGTALLSELSKGTYTEADFKGMEVEMLFDLNWLLNGPTAVSFLEHYLLLLPLKQFGISTDLILQNAQYQIERSAHDYELVRYNPSTIALAAMVSSIKRITSTPDSAIYRSKLMKAVEEITATSLQSASLRHILNRMEQHDELPIIQSRRNSVPRQTALSKKGTKQTRRGSKSYSPTCVQT